MARRFESFEEFLPYYVAMHRLPLTRALHATGTLTGAALALHGLARGRWRAVLWLPLVGYGLAWPAHFLLEHNNPATFGHPAWSLRGDLHMIGALLRGRDADLQDVADTWLVEHAGEADIPLPVNSPRVITVDPVIDLPA
jgi:hypothetical protein